MGRRSKEQRRRKREAKERAHRKQSDGLPKERPEPWVAPKMKLFKLPPLFKDEVSREKRLEMLRTIGKDADTKFLELYPQITKWVTEYDSVYVLSMSVFYLVAYQEGTDPEATGELDFFHHYLELLQAFALCQPRTLTAKPLRAEMSALKKHLQEVGELISVRRFNIPKHLTTDKEISAYRLRMEMMGQTAAIRNWAYPHQMRSVLLDLSGLIAHEFQALYRVHPVQFFEMLLGLPSDIQERLNAHIDKIRQCVQATGHTEIIAAYNLAFPENEPIAGEWVDLIWERAGKKRMNLLSMLMTHSDLKLERIYTFSLNRSHELAGAGSGKAALAALLDKISHRFGDLATENKEHFILSNPVLTRPFIKLDDGEYFSAVWGVLPHMALDILEDLVWQDEKVRAIYTRAKAQYLEDQLERVVRSGFPNGQVFRGSRWKDPTGVEYENDLIVVIDTFAVVFEAKSASVTDPARRGAPARLAETLRELIEAPSEQALRFADLLRSEPKVHRFETKRGETNVIDSRQIKHYIPIGVTLSHLGFIASNLKKLIDAGVVDKTLEELAPSMSITDLESVFELLPSEVEKVHYLARRREFEAHMRYEGDEMDLLGFYLDNGFNIGDTEYDQDTVFNMGLKSKELDPYFVGSREGKDVQKPRLSMTDWWRALLDQINHRRFEGWVETGFILLNTTRDDQEKFEKEFKSLARRVREGTAGHAHNWIVWESGPKRRRYVVIGYPYMSSDREARNAVLFEAMDGVVAGHARGVVGIGINLEHPHFPYDVLVRRTATDLIDSLTLEPRTEAGALGSPALSGSPLR